MDSCTEYDNCDVFAAAVLVMVSNNILALFRSQASFRVRADPGKVWKVLEFNVEIFKALKSLENDHRYGKVWKNP